MTWYHESIMVMPAGWEAWSKQYPGVECRWLLRVVAEPRTGKYKIVTGDYSVVINTKLDQEHLDKRYDTWQDALGEAHILVSTVAKSHQNLTWPEAKAKIEAESDPVLF